MKSVFIIGIIGKYVLLDIPTSINIATSLPHYIACNFKPCVFHFLCEVGIKF